MLLTHRPSLNGHGASPACNEAALDPACRQWSGSLPPPQELSQRHEGPSSGASTIEEILERAQVSPPLGLGVSRVDAHGPRLQVPQDLTMEVSDRLATSPEDLIERGQRDGDLRQVEHTTLHNRAKRARA